MTIQLPEHLERYVHDQVLAGRFRTEDDVILDALERHRQAQQPPAAPAIRRDELGSQEVQQRLFDAGLISEIKPPITDVTLTHKIHGCNFIDRRRSVERGESTEPHGRRAQSPL